VTFVNDDSSIVSKWSFKLIDDPRVLIYDHHRLILQATGQTFLISFLLLKDDLDNMTDNFLDRFRINVWSTTHIRHLLMSCLLVRTFSNFFALASWLRLRLWLWLFKLQTLSFNPFFKA